MLKRITLFMLTNFLVLTSVFIIMMLIGVERWIGYNYFWTLVILSTVIGFSGALISLLMSRWAAKWAMKVQLLDGREIHNHMEQFILNEVHTLAKQAGLTRMPEVGIYPSREINAFATGPSKKRSLVALSSGLVEMGDTKMMRGIIAHEIAHIKNGDMVTMTLLQGIINTLVVMLSRAIANVVSQVVREDLAFLVYFTTSIICEILFSILSSPVIFWFSRVREFKADELGARLSEKETMIHALEMLRFTAKQVDVSQKSVAAFKISNGKEKFALLFSTHPPLVKRIERLKSLSF